MVRKLLLVAAGALALDACSLFTDSPFPWYLPSVTATRDLGPWIGTIIPEEAGLEEWGLGLAILRDDAGSDFVFISVDRYDGDDLLIVLDSDLAPYPGPGLNLVDDIPNLGRRAMIDANGDFVIGTQRLDPMDLDSPLDPTPGSPEQPGFTDGTANFLLSVENPYPTESSLRLYGHDSGWDSTADKTAQISSGMPHEWDLPGAVYDPARPVNERIVLLLLKRGTESTPSSARIVFTGLPDPPPPLVESNPGFTIAGVEIRRMHYTRKGIVVRDHDNRAWLFGLDGGERMEMIFSEKQRIEDAYDLDGEHFYFVDRDTRRIFKGKTGW